MEPTTTVREQILDHAITLIMLRGYNGFSYRDLSSLVGVKTSSIHYYFPSKDDLVLEAVNAYSNEVLGALHGINASLAADTMVKKTLAFRCMSGIGVSVRTRFLAVSCQATGSDVGLACPVASPVRCPSCM